MTDNPADVLRRAADILERRAADASAEDSEFDTPQYEEYLRLARQETLPSMGAPACDWFEAMPPTVAAPLVAWLRYSAPAVEMFPGHAPDSAKHALDFARAVLAAAGEDVG